MFLAPIFGCCYGGGARSRPVDTMVMCVFWLFGGVEVGVMVMMFGGSSEQEH